MRKGNYEWIKNIKYLRHDILLKFFELVEKINLNSVERDLLIFKMLYSTGARCYEFSQIKYEDIDFENNLIIIRPMNEKADKIKQVRINKELMRELKSYLRFNKITSGFIFRKKDGSCYTVRFYEKLFDRYFKHPVVEKELNLPFKPSPHKIRHSHIITALQKGVPINAIQQNVGHSSLETTLIYSILAGEDVARAYKDVDF